MKPHSLAPIILPSFWVKPGPGIITMVWYSHIDRVYTGNLSLLRYKVGNIIIGRVGDKDEGIDHQVYCSFDS